MDNLLPIGRFSKAHGLDGQIMVKVEERYLEDLLAAEAVFAETQDGSLPYFIIDILAGKDIVLILEDIDDREAAAALAGKTLLVRESDLLPAGERLIPVEQQYQKYVGFQLQDQTKGAVGEISAILDYPQQVMAVVPAADKEHLIPLHDELIIEIRSQDKLILVDLPEGLLDL